MKNLIIGIAVFLVITLPFHYVPSQLMVFPKEKLSFDNTVIFQRQIDNAVNRLNSPLYKLQKLQGVEVKSDKLYEKLLNEGVIIKQEPETTFLDIK